MPAEPWTMTARWVFPVAGPPRPGGTVTVRGPLVEAVEPAGRRVPDVDLGSVALIPGLVNAHTHLDLSAARGRTPVAPGGPFPDWLRSVIDVRRSQSADDTTAAIRAGLAECLTFGTTLIGDVSADGRSWAALADAPVRAVVFRELLGVSDGRAAAAIRDYSEWLSATAPTATCRPGVSPHAPYSASVRLFLTAVAAGVPVATHLAESAAEVELLERRTGPFVPFLQSLGVWEPDAIGGSVGEYPVLAGAARANAYPGVRPPLLFVHGNHLRRDVVLPDPAASVVYCPRTHAAFGHPPHPFRDLLATGNRVCLGTDGLSSNPDLDVLAEARFLRRRHPDVPGERLLRMATLAGAEALGWADETGSLEPGKSADLVAVPLVDEGDPADPHDLIFAATAADAGRRRTLFRGQWR